MGERRAVRVSYELWEQAVKQGYVTAGFRCIQGLPEDAALYLVSVYDGLKPDPVFVFESEKWSTPPREETIKIDRTTYPVEQPVFQIAECRTCKHWQPSAHKLTGECILTRDDDYVPVHKESAARAVASCDDAHPTSWLQTGADFGCTQYEPRENND